MVDPLLTQERIDALLRELAEDVLVSEGLESFLTVTTPEGGTPTVITVSRLSNSAAEWGRHPNIMGMCMVYLGKFRRGKCLR